jgi:hypothetical protein
MKRDGRAGRLLGRRREPRAGARAMRRRAGA